MGSEPLTLKRAGKRHQEKFEAAVGSLVLVWGAIDTYLDLCILCTYHINGKPAKHSKLYFPLSQKIQYLRAQTKLNSRFGKLHQRIDGLMNELEKAAVVRHDIVHGTVLQQTLDERGTLTVTLGSFLQPPNRSRRPAATFSVEQVREAGEYADSLADECLKLATDMTKLFGTRQ